jgi:hypothetical protein
MDGIIIGTLALAIMVILTIGILLFMLGGADHGMGLVTVILTIMVTHIMVITITITEIYTTEEIYRIVQAEEALFMLIITQVESLIDAAELLTDEVQ